MDWDQIIGFRIKDVPYVWSGGAQWTECSRTYIGHLDWIAEDPDVPVRQFFHCGDTFFHPVNKYFKYTTGMPFSLDNIRINGQPVKINSRKVREPYDIYVQASSPIGKKEFPSLLSTVKKFKSSLV